MYETRVYSDFAISRPIPHRLSLGRRGLIVAAPAAMLTIGAGVGAADAQVVNALNAINAAVGVITNIDAMADRIWPKIQGFFRGSPLNPGTVARVTEAVGHELSRPNVQAVSISENRTEQTQTGVIQHAIDQNYSAAYVEWCTCSAQMHETTAQYWRNYAAQAEASGQMNAASWARARAARDEADADMFRRKLQGIVRVAPIPATLPPNKPFLTAVSAPSAVTDVLDQGDYFVCHATAQQRSDAGLATV